MNKLIFVLILVWVFTSSHAQDRSRKVIENIALEYNLSGRSNGLAKSYFMAEARLITSRNTSTTSLYLTIIPKQSSPDHPTPSYLYDYRYNGVAYGDGHVGKDVFRPINAPRSALRYKVIVQGSGLNWTGTIDGIHSEISTKLPKDVDISGFSVHIEVFSIDYFSGTTQIEKKIREILAEEQKTKDAEKKAKQVESLVEQANKKKEANDLTGAKNLLKQAQQMLPGNKEIENELDQINQLIKEQANQKSTEGNSSNSTATKSAPKPKNQKTSDDEFWNQGGASNSSGKSAQKPREKTVQEVQAEVKNTLEQKDREFWDQKRESDQKIERAGELSSKSFYAAQAVDNANSNVKSLSTLDGTYSSLEELEQAFQEKFLQINQAINEQTSAKNNKLQSDADYLWRDSNSSDKAVGDIVVGAGQLINSFGEEKRKREAKAKLEKERDAIKAKMEKDMADQKRAMMLDLRKTFISQFPDGGVPLSSHNIEQDDLFYFAYALSEMDLNNDHPVIYLTNVFSISRYGDGTWPFKNNILAEIKKLAPGKITLMGYYGNPGMTNKTRASFISLSEKSGFVLKNITYKGKKGSGSTNKTSDDFWETGEKQPAKTEANKNMKAKEDEFWNQ